MEINLSETKTVEAEDFVYINHAMHDKEGNPQLVECIEFTVIGNNHQWKNGMPITEFLQYNEGFDLDEVVA